MPQSGWCGLKLWLEDSPEAHHAVMLQAHKGAFGRLSYNAALLGSWGRGRVLALRKAKFPVYAQATFQ